MSETGSDSDDSENEGGLGNVSRVVMRPAGHSGKAKRGHICFDASFETGNLGRVDLISEYEYDLFIRPDTCNPRLRLWFNFTVDNVRADQRVIFNIVNLSKPNNLFREGMTPIVRSTSRPKWQRMSSKHVYYYRSPEHHNHFILSFAFGFDREEDVYQFALSFPYSYSRCQAHADALERRNFNFLRRQQIATSLQQRSIDMLTITHTQNLQAGRKQRVVFILSRVHPGESPTSFVCQGLIDFLISSHPIALALREYVVFHVVPMLNPDGVYLGNYRSSVMGCDLNRTWHQSSPWSHPALHTLLQMLQELDNDKNVNLDFVIDLHAHSSLLGAFIYGNTYEDVYRYERHIVYQKLLAQNAEDFCQANTMYNRDSSKAGTARRYICSLLKDSVNCYTLEVSLYGYQRSNDQGIVPYNEDAYLRLGRNVARTFCDYYRAIGVMQTSCHLPTAGPSTLTAHPRKTAAAPSCASTSSTEHVAATVTSTDDDLDETASKMIVRASKAPLQNVLQLPSSVNNAHLNPFPCRLTNLRRSRVAASVPEAAVIRTPQRSRSPCLTIIDFNQLTRGGLDVATGKVARREAKMSGVVRMASTSLSRKGSRSLRKSRSKVQKGNTFP
ncbi:cytosolic carboxypeptidase 6 [Neocloeon triangulifer]|uniref:cytosolic carboxypeptidase 6 n=1 Tax=Neocloeon triangulifer TaxID=2078957 RepID=UPI00286F61EB|nr:cytosolic carboxypeptidase 6 [Neocloeon triangulifer]